MPRAKTGTVRRARHKKILKRAKGFWGLRSKSVRVAQQTLLNAADYAYRDRRDKKNDFRRLWISRINAGDAPGGPELLPLHRGAAGAPGSRSIARSSPTSPCASPRPSRPSSTWPEAPRRRRTAAAGGDAPPPT
jgi:hypothetical protein